jgi:hypothetical protein
MIRVIKNNKGDDPGEILDIILSSGKVDNHESFKQKSFHNRVFGKLFGDRIYIGQILFFEQLYIGWYTIDYKVAKKHE